MIFDSVYARKWAHRVNQRYNPDLVSIAAEAHEKGGSFILTTETMTHHADGVLPGNAPPKQLTLQDALAETAAIERQENYNPGKSAVMMVSGCEGIEMTYRIFPVGPMGIIGSSMTLENFKRRYGRSQTAVNRRAPA